MEKLSNKKSLKQLFSGLKSTKPAKRKKSYDKKIFRLLYILNKLDAGQAINTLKLAKEFNVTQRTIQRDLELLEMVGFPLSLEREGYKFLEGFSLGKIVINEEEKRLLSMFYLLCQKAGKPFNKIGKEFLSKVLKFSDKSRVFTQAKAVKENERRLKKAIKSIYIPKNSKYKPKEFSESQEEKIKHFIDQMKEKIENLKKEKGVEIEAIENPQKIPMRIRLSGDIFSDLYRFAENKAVRLLIKTPAKHFQDPKGLIYLDELLNFKITPYLDFKETLEMHLKVELTLKVIDPHLSAKDITCFDEFTDYLGFRKEKKNFSYEASFRNGEISDDEAKLTWSEKI